jgi:hypothetical protein
MMSMYMGSSPRRSIAAATCRDKLRPLNNQGLERFYDAHTETFGKCYSLWLLDGDRPAGRRRRGRGSSRSRAA